MNVTSSTPTLSPVSSDYELTNTDRCDRCGAQAYIRVVLAGGGDLLFCGHHGREHEESLRRVAVDFRDETAKLDQSPASPARS